MKMVATLLYGIDIIPYWLKYYSRIGVEEFHLINFLSTRVVARIGHGYRVVSHEYTGEMDGGVTDHIRINRVAGNVVKNGEWFVVADLDEFHWSEGIVSLDGLCSEQYDHVRSRLVDRVSRDGRLTSINHAYSLCHQYPITADVTNCVAGGNTSKVALVKGGFCLGPGHHTASGTPSPFSIQTHHFKWAGPTITSVIAARTPRRDCEYRSECVRTTDHIRDHGRIRIEDPSLNSRDGEDIGI